MKKFNLFVESQIPDSTSPELVCDTYAQGELEFAGPVRNYKSSMVMIKLSNAGFGLVDIRELKQIVDTIYAMTSKGD